jgi:ribosomal-protein-serine acetyltransferase
MNNNKAKKLSNTIIIDEAYALKAAAIKDAEVFFKVVSENQNHFLQYEFISPKFESVEQLKNIIRLLDLSKRDSRGASYGLWNDQNLLGLFTINEINWENRIADVGYWLVESAMGQGLGLRGFTALIEHCFQRLELASLTAHTAVSNTRSQQLLMKAGFQKVKVLEKSITVRGTPVDEILFSRHKS